MTEFSDMPPQNKSNDNRSRSTVKYKFYRTLLNTFALLPLWMLYGISDIVCFILHKVIKYRVKVVRKNLAMAFPEKTEKERIKIERRFYRHLCDIFIETAKLAHISNKEIEKRVQIVGMEHIDHALDNGKSVVVMLGHFGNWEWVTSIALKIRPDAVSCEIYHPLRDKDFDRVMLELRSRFGSENIPMARTLRRLLEITRDGKKFVCGFISDQRPLTPVKKYWTDFMGKDTAYLNGGEVIGTKMGAEFVYLEMMPVKRGHYVMTISPLTPLHDGGENPYSRAYLNRLEDSIRRNPSAWLWSHNRWKHSRC